MCVFLPYMCFTLCRQQSSVVSEPIVLGRNRVETARLQGTHDSLLWKCRHTISALAGPVTCERALMSASPIFLTLPKASISLRFVTGPMPFMLSIVL